MRAKEFLNRHSLVMGVVLMFALTWPFYSALGLFVGYGLALASLIVTALTLGRSGVLALLRRFLIWRVPVYWFLVVLVGPAMLGLAALGLDYVVRGAVPGWGNVYAHQIFGTTANLWLFIIPFFLVDALSNGEELGWRGFVLPRLQTRFSALVSSLILGAVWGLWHLPKFWAGSASQSFVWVMLHSIAVAILFTWVSGNTGGSLLVATLFHASVNTAYIFLPLGPSGRGDEMTSMIYTAVELAVALCVVVVAGPARLSRQIPGQAHARGPTPLFGPAGWIEPGTGARHDATPGRVSAGRADSVPQAVRAQEAGPTVANQG